MSTGARVNIDLAAAWAERLLDRWRLGKVEEDKAPESPIDVLPVGSCRRLEETVGDLEFLAVVPPGWTRAGRCDFYADPLFQRINATLINPYTPRPAVQPALFGDTTHPPQSAPTPAAPITPFARAVDGGGFKPGFLEASIEILNKNGSVLIPVQIFRCERGAWGWQAAMRTGPADLGKLLLKEWKRRQGTLATDKPGSVDGYLVNARGERRECHSEREFFELVGVGYTEPEARTRLMCTLRPH